MWIGESAPGGKWRRSASSAARACALGGSTLASTPMNRAFRNGRPSAISTVALAMAIGSGWRITQWANRYQPPRSSGRAARSAARCQLAGASAFTFVPSRAKSAGSTVSATSPASGAMISPPMAIERRKPSGNTSSDANAAATVTALNATVRPAVWRVARSASTPGPCRTSSSR